LKIRFTNFLIKLLSSIPISMQKKIGYSSIGSALVPGIRNKGSELCYTIDYGVKIYFEITNPLTWQLIQGKDVEKNVKNVFFDNISEKDTVIDVGAHIGEYSLLASKKLRSNGQVISIEPLKEARKWLNRNLELNGCLNTVVLECAIGNELQKRPLYMNTQGGTFGYLDSEIEGIKLEKTAMVNVTTLDQIISSREIEKVDMLKIDVEGSEYEVLLGCKKSFEENKIKKIICEIHPNFLAEKGLKEQEIHSLLEENGFHITTIEELKYKKTKHILATLEKIDGN